VCWKNLENPSSWSRLVKRYHNTHEQITQQSCKLLILKLSLLVINLVREMKSSKTIEVLGLTTILVFGHIPNNVLKLLKNLYGQKQASWVWNQHFTHRLQCIRFKQSKIDECIFYCSQTIFVFYVNDGIFAGPSQKEINKVIKDLNQAGFDIKDKAQ
jgi:hypothetical protein